MSKLIAIDAGHGLHTAGKRTPDGEREWTFNNEVVLALIDELHRLGLRTLRLDDPSGQRDVPLGERTRKANNAKADVLVSVHHNAVLRSGWGDHTGTEIYSYPNAKSSADLSKKLQPILSNAYGLRNRGAKTANFHMLRESNMPAILTEGGYMDSRIDIVKMRDDEVRKRAGGAIAKVVAEYAGVKGAKPVPPSAKPAPTPKPKPKPVATSVAQLADEVLASGKTGNDARAKFLGMTLAQYEPIRQEINRRYSAKPKPVAPKTVAKPGSNWNYKGGNWTGQVLKQGDYGPQVLQLQQMLARKHFYPEKGAKNNGVDSYYGAKTADATGRFQSIHGLKVDKIAGKATYNKLK